MDILREVGLEKISKWYKVRPLQQGICTKAGSEGKSIRPANGNVEVPLRISVEELATAYGNNYKHVTFDKTTIKDIVQKFAVKSEGSKVTGKVVLAKGSNEITKVAYGKHYTRERMKKVLKSNIEYTSPGGQVYKTDEKGRITSVEGSLDLGNGKRNNYAQRIAEREDRLPDDQGGHLIASIFKGSGQLDNLVPMNSNLNMREWKKIEIS